MYDMHLRPVSNRADWIEMFEIVDDDTGNVITDFTGVTMQLEIRSQYPSCRCLSGSTDDGHITPAIGGVMQWHFTRDEMRSLGAGTYEIGLTVTRDAITEQELIGCLPIVDGIVR